MRAAAEAGLDVVALTDHDTAQGWAEATEAAAEARASTWCSASRSAPGSDRRGVHLLAYLPDADDPELVTTLDRDPRGPQRPGAGDPRPAARGRRRPHRGRRTPGGGRHARHRAAARRRRPRGARRGRDRGPRRSSGTSTPGAPATPRRFAADLEDVVPMVVAAGGVPVVAHPWGRTARAELTDRGVRGAEDLGLAGIEVDHQDHDADRARGAARDRPQARPRRHRVQRLPRRGQGRPRPRLQHHGARGARPHPRARRRRPHREGRQTGWSMSDLVDITLLTSAFVTLFVIMDPVGTVPIFLSLTGGRSKATRPPGGVAGRRRVVRGDHGRSPSSASGSWPTCTSRCPRCSARADCSCCSSPSSC